MLDFLKFGGGFAFIAFLILIFMHLLTGALAKTRRLFFLVKPLSAVALICSVYTVFNGAYFISDWEVSAFFDALSENPKQAGRVAGARRGGGTLILFFIAFWPWVSVIFGGLMSNLYFGHFQNPVEALKDE